MLQSVSMKEYDKDIFKSFGLIIFDECHHLGAEMFSKCMPKVASKYMLGLSATPDRKDGLRKVFEWPKIIETASSKYEPHKIPYYLYELATLFHSYWSKGNEDQSFKFIENGKIKITH